MKAKKGRYPGPLTLRQRTYTSWRSSLRQSTSPRSVPTSPPILRSSSTGLLWRYSEAGITQEPTFTVETTTSHTLGGTAVTFSPWLSETWVTIAGTGVAFTRDPGTGAKGLFGEFLTNAQERT